MIRGKKMNPEIKPLWLEALRSNEYEQGGGSLKNNGKLCCLGVLCEVAIKAGVEVAVSTDGNGDTVYDGSVAYLPMSVAGWAGVDDIGLIPKRVRNPRHSDVESLTNSLPVLNDSGCVSFAQIADIIEEQL